MKSSSASLALPTGMNEAFTPVRLQDWTSRVSVREQRTRAGTLRVVAKRDRRDPESRAGLLVRVRGEFYEMPCLRLTCDEAQRLLGLRPDVCGRVLDDLVVAGQLTQTAAGRYTQP